MITLCFLRTHTQTHFIISDWHMIEYLTLNDPLTIFNAISMYRIINYTNIRYLLFLFFDMHSHKKTKTHRHRRFTQTFTHSLTPLFPFPVPSLTQYIGSDDNNADNDADFKCDKCDNNEGVISSQKETTTILKDNAKPINKPILKFSVSAILGDKKECARVRHGKCIHCIPFNLFDLI